MQSVTYCFMSSAKEDTEDPCFEKFAKDFRHELGLVCVNEPAEELLFHRAHSIQFGENWEAKVEDALCSTKTFIAMISPRYLRSSEITTELKRFEWRLTNYGQVDSAALLLPLLWIPTPDKPSQIDGLQAANVLLGKTYAARGMRYLVQMGGAAYRRALGALVEHMRNLIAGPSLPPSASLPISKLSIQSTELGPKHVEFIVVAARRDEIDSMKIRSALDAYGRDPCDWCPYVPDVNARIGLLVQPIASAEGLTSNPIAGDHDLTKRLQEARAKNTMIILIVDIWSLKLSSYINFVAALDRERFHNAGVLVLWNTYDGDNVVNETDLALQLRAAFFNLTTAKDPKVFHERLSTVFELRNRLRATLHELRRRIIAYGEVMRRPPGSPPIPQPHISGPGGR